MGEENYNHIAVLKDVDGVEYTVGEIPSLDLNTTLDKAIKKNEMLQPIEMEITITDKKLIRKLKKALKISFLEKLLMKFQKRRIKRIEKVFSSKKTQKKYKRKKRGGLKMSVCQYCGQVLIDNKECECPRAVAERKRRKKT